MITLLLAIGGLTVGAVLLLLLPLLRNPRAQPGRARYDSAVYRDQLKELERDVARGLIAEAEARSARVEIERRLLAAAAAPSDAVVAGGRSPLLAAALAVLVAGGAIALYLRLGAPGVPDTPFAEGRSAAAGADHTDLAGLAAALAEKLRADPNDREGWQLYARTLGTLGNWQGSVEAWRRLIALGGASADTYADYGEALVLDSEGAVTPPAREAFGDALRSDAANPIARFYLALADAQDGHGRQALDAWVKLAGEVADERLRAEIARRLAETAKLSGLPLPAMPPAPQQAAARPVEADQAGMVKAMVAELAARLKASPDDADGWVRLGGAYAMMGEHAKAADAYGHAVSLRGDDASVLAAGARELIEAAKPDAPAPQAAIEWLRRAEQIDPKRPEVLWYLGMAEAQAGRIDAAQGYWRRLLGLLPANSPDRRLVSDAIAALPKR
jgi:cytochrome c-type biogenesis protein CcmH